MGERVTVFEMGPRDGLQNEAAPIATADKIALVNALSECGLPKIEVTSLAMPHKRLRAQMIDSASLA